MASFFEKLKKGMGVEVSEEQSTDLEEASQEPMEEAEVIPEKKKSKKLEIEAELNKSVSEKIKKPEKSTIEEFKTTEREEPKKDKWFGQEGQLAIDVYQTDMDLIIQSTIAGVKPEDLDISIEADTVLIRGNREEPREEEEKSYFYQECYWGPFSRQIILPEETDPTRAQASMKEGVLTIRIPKIERKKKRKIVVKA
jgi:HSP20 family protein